MKYVTLMDATELRKRSQNFSASWGSIQEGGRRGSASLFSARAVLRCTRKKISTLGNFFYEASTFFCESSKRKLNDIVAKKTSRNAIKSSEYFHIFFINKFIRSAYGSFFFFGALNGGGPSALLSRKWFQVHPEIFEPSSLNPGDQPWYAMFLQKVNLKGCCKSF